VTARLPAAGESDRTVDAYLGGRVTLVQPVKGHRAGLDAALLQALVPDNANGRAVDLGTGVGTVAFCVAARAPGVAVTGVEREAELVACARSALAIPGNAGFAGRVAIIEADVADRRALRGGGELAHPVDWVLMNPPYFTPGRTQPSPDPARRSAHSTEAGMFASWARSAADLLKPGGTLGLIHRADALMEVLEALAGRFGDVRVLPVHPSEGAAATRILVRSRRGSRAPLQVRPGLVLHRPGGGWTDEADAILRGERDLSI
jgi:tRNA1(Val) A37 N6-methylase TrmN6